MVVGAISLSVHFAKNIRQRTVDGVVRVVPATTIAAGERVEKGAVDGQAANGRTAVVKAGCATRGPFPVPNPGELGDVHAESRLDSRGEVWAKEREGGIAESGEEGASAWAGA
jgi:hypothetical protein